MPSLDTIRTVTIRGQADGVDQTRAALDRLTASLNVANQNLAQTKQIANDNAAGFSLTGESAVSAANHLRQAAEAAYAFSPAFRSVVNEMAAPALKGASVALESVAAGIVTATNVAGTGVIKLGTAIETTFPAFAALGATVKTAGAAMEAFSPTLGGAAASILSRLLPALSLLGKGLLIVDAVQLLTEAWRLGNERLAEYVAIAEKASASGLSTDFYQRITEAAKDAKTPVDALTEAFKKLSQAAGPDLGGTAAQNRLKTLVDAGNFSGNSGIGDLKSANSNEERLRALSTLYDQALDKGQRLAALDLVKAFGGDQLAANLARDSGYLDKLLESADEIAGKELISAGDIQRAVELQDRLDAAEKILSQRWHPIQELLADLGVKMKETWVSIVEAIANAVDAVFKLGQRIADALAPVMSFMQAAGQLIGKAAPYLATVPGAQPLAIGAASIGVLSTPSSNVDQQAAQQQAQMADARKRLAEAMSKKFDTSKAPQTDEGKDAYDRATESILKYIEVTKAAADTVGLTVAQQEKAKAVAQLTAAAMKDGTPITAALRDEMQKLGDKAAAAAEALEKAKIAADIKFNRNTSLLSQEDVQIATSLKGIYPDVATALGSVEAQAMRTNNAFKSMSSALENELVNGLTDIVSGTKSASQGFQDMANAIVKALEQMVIKIMIVEPLMRSLQASVSGMGGLGGLFGGGSSSSGTGLSLTSTGGLYHSGGIVGLEPTSLRSVNDNLFSGAPRFHTGGIAGDEVPIIAKKGEGVFTPGQMAAMGNSGAPQVNVTLIQSANADGSVKQKPNANGGVDLEIAVAQIVARSAATPGGTMNRVLTDQFGVAQRLASR